MPHTGRTIRDLVQGFAQHIRELKAPDYKESQLRLHYLDPFWELLGWDVSNRQQASPQDVEVLVEPSMDTVDDEGLRTREPDYLFRLNGFPRFIVEAKKPAVDVDSDRRAIYQAKRYAWNATIPLAVLTDFEQFRLYDTTLRPILGEPGRGLVLEFSINFEDYPSKWDELVATIGREAVAAGSLERLLAKIKKQSPRRRIRTVDRTLADLRGAEPVDRVFLDYLETYRKHVASAIYHDNKRERGTYEGHGWYGYVYPKNLASMGLPKLLTPSLAQRGEFCIDPTGELYFVGSGGGGGGGYGILLQDAKMHEYVLGLLNSALLNWFVQKITTPFHSGWFAYNKQFIEQVPIKLPETAAEKKLAGRIVESVRAIMAAKVKLRDAKPSDRERSSLDGEVEQHEGRIDEAVFRLYGVDGLPG